MSGVAAVWLLTPGAVVGVDVLQCCHEHSLKFSVVRIVKGIRMVSKQIIVAIICTALLENKLSV